MKKILIIEDNEEIRDNTRELLTLAGYETYAAGNGRIGVDMAISERPDLIICDIMMPELDGYGVLHILSKRNDTASIPFIFLTALTEKSEFRKGMDLGADDYLTKPFDETNLLNAIEVRLRKNSIRQNSYSPTVEGLDDFLRDAGKVLTLKDLSSGKKVIHLKKKAELFNEGETPSAVYLVKSGEVKVSKLHQDGKELIISVHHNDDFFGFEPILENSTYMASATTMTDTELVVIPKEDFLLLLFGHADVSAAFISLLCKKVSEKEAELLNLAYSSVRQRTATTLLKVSEWKDGRLINISREDLARMVGTAPESVIRVLSDFKDEKLISIESGKIKVQNRERLEKVVRWNVAR